MVANSFAYVFAEVECEEQQHRSSGGQASGYCEHCKYIDIIASSQEGLNYTHTHANLKKIVPHLPFHERER